MSKKWDFRVQPVLYDEMLHRFEIARTLMKIHETSGTRAACMQHVLSVIVCACMSV
jgi:hypothetical protein